ncbi:mannose-1-phosphate guanylyltransferase/mannose-6-phosphate isomerase [Rhodothalassium salexigens]|uniref:mannose-1-phosphate guanylyltransferase/mannose-6-phosphate isomerase n=1 Tax=Rhodothalassium salexigens TaxID=1086 RepID=UPI0031FEE788|nr:mannose-1-phosphate guanylyltransferase/mannose-6-phosphate isomerase [Rhodothalassium salexigens]MBK5919506.1 mannose-1-phosphate guanylyltransferase/mannose-6-phosphate isomerase [Rhodothalassium salexigens]
MDTDGASRLICPVILSGGTGSRLWPLSRAGYPKQFLPLAGDRTLFQDTVARVATPGFAEPLVICNDDHRFIVAEQLRSAGAEARAIVLEPVGRNTAPAAAIAALHLLGETEDGDDPLMLIMPSDHRIAEPDAFRAAVERAAPAAAAGALVTFGITPDRPETGYGYIKAAGAYGAHGGVSAVERFVEKPDAETAAGYLAAGGYHWNSGIFLVSARRYLDELTAQHPDMVTACRAALDGAAADLTFCRLDAEAFARAPADSIDYAVMEHTERAAVVPVAMGWSDLGAWSAVWDAGTKDAEGNATRGDVILHDTRNAYVRAEHGLVAVAGLDDVVVVATDDAVLVADRRRAQDVKALVERLKADGRSEHDLHTTVHRPWGSYRGVDRGERFQVKRLTVAPGERLSLQMHHHRAEHWVVVSGTARVTRGCETFLLGENQSTYIPMGEVHRLENPGKLPLHLIEVQSGSYLEEDDIVRFEDGYGRHPAGEARPAGQGGPDEGAA